MGPILVIAVIFSGLVSMSRSKTMNPKSVPRGTLKTHFSGLSLMFFCLKAFERDIEIVNQIVDLPGFYYDVVNVGLNGWPDVFPENVLHASLVCSPRVLETEGHSNVAIHAERGDE
jgi:hypothetical protein